MRSHHGPLWPDCHSGLLVELYRLLVTTDNETLLYAIQLSVLLLPRNTSTHLRHLLLFMCCAASPTQVSLSLAASDQISLNVVVVNTSVFLHLFVVFPFMSQCFSTKLLKGLTQGEMSL